VALALEPAASGAAPVVAWADRTRLRQVLINLLSNAVKYNRAGGWVRVRVHALAHAQPLAPPRAVQLEVEDGGQGIAPEDLAQVFEPFQRGRHVAGAVDGAGIGLAVTRALVQLMGGEVAVASTPGQGSTFSVVLPAAPAEPAEPA
jgi:signal transduction histidine kinase